jgi:hypothetical protein
MPRRAAAGKIRMWILLLKEALAGFSHRRVVRKLFRSLVWMGVLAAPAGLWAQKVKVAYDQKADFSKYKTYSWTKLGIPAANPDVDRRIVSAIDQQLGAKGVTRVDQDGSLFVTYESAVDHQVSLDDYGYHYGPGWQREWWAAGGANTPGNSILVGEVAVALIDPSLKQFVWRAKGHGVLSPDILQKPEKLEKTINKIFEKMFDKFPPKTK